MSATCDAAASETKRTEGRSGARGRRGDPIDAAKAEVHSFGAEVERIVKGCSDSEARPKPVWVERKTAYLARIAKEDHSVLLVSAADKLHTARSIVSDLHVVGDWLWRRFNAPQEQTLW